MLKTKKIILILIAVGIVAIVSGYIFVFYSNKTETIILGKQKFQAEVVFSPEQMQKGLGGRNDLCQSCGMLFQFASSGKYDFWMKDMRFPLDIIWISDGKIVHIEKNVPADFSGILISSSEADQVLEINAGITDKLGIKAGDIIAF